LENNTYYLLKLKPLSKEMKKFFKEIDIYFDRKDVSVSIIKMTELSGDYTEIKFISKRLNVEIPDDKFILK
jgi:outer membrane lipoprotein-sorting protein